MSTWQQTLDARRELAAQPDFLRPPAPPAQPDINALVDERVRAELERILNSTNTTTTTTTPAPPAAQTPPANPGVLLDTPTQQAGWNTGVTPGSPVG